MTRTPREILRAKESLALDISLAIERRFFTEQPWYYDSEEARHIIAGLLPDTRAEAQAEAELIEKTLGEAFTPPPGESPIAKLRKTLRMPDGTSISDTIRAAIQRINQSTGQPIHQSTGAKRP